MCKRLIFLSSLVLVIGFVGHASGGDIASNPSPADGAQCVNPNTTLTWSPGDRAIFHDVYLGTTFGVLPLVSSQQVSNTYDYPGGLGPCTTYYWRIDDVNDFEPNSPWIGDVWSFTTSGENCCNCIQPPANMVAWWPLDENVGDISDDAVWNNDGTWMGSPKPVEGMVAGAIELNSITGDYVKVPDAPELNFGTGDLSIDAWIDTNQQSGAIVDKRTDSPVKGYVLALSGRNLCFQLANGVGVGWTNYCSSLSVETNQWNHVAVTVDRDDPNGLVLYVNGISQKFNPTGRSGNLTNTGNLLIGANCLSLDTISASIDEVELFNRALTEDEILAIYEAGSDGKCKCEQGPPTFADDIKWSQPPENYAGCINGWDEDSIYNTEPVIADDWVCMDNRPVTEIHWWGSFKGWTEHVPPPDKPIAFHIGIWTDVPNPDMNNPSTFSHPDLLIWENICDCSVWSYAGCDIDPRGIDQNEACFKFDQLLSQDKWFYQYGNEPNGTVYWLSIAAIYDGNTPAHQWGWKTRPHLYNDDALRIRPPTSICPNSCPDPNFSELPAGVNDVFASPTPVEYSSPRPGLVAWVVAHDSEHRTPMNFDEIPTHWPDPENCNRFFAHTFENLPCCITAATLEMRLKRSHYAGGGESDAIALGLNDATGKFTWGSLIGTLVPGGWEPADKMAVVTLNIAASVIAHMNTTGRLDVCVQDDSGVDYMILRVWSCPLTNNQWPPVVGSFWENGEPIEYPEGISWDTAFVLTTNRQYTPKLGYWPDDANEPPVPDPNPWNRTRATRTQADLYSDLVIDFKDFAVLAGYWLDEGMLWPEHDDP